MIFFFNVDENAGHKIDTSYNEAKKRSFDWLLTGNKERCVTCILRTSCITGYKIGPRKLNCDTTDHISKYIKNFSSYDLSIKKNDGYFLILVFHI